MEVKPIETEDVDKYVVESINSYKKYLEEELFTMWVTVYELKDGELHKALNKVFTFTEWTWGLILDQHAAPEMKHLAVFLCGKCIQQGDLSDIQIHNLENSFLPDDHPDKGDVYTIHVSTGWIIEDGKPETFELQTDMASGTTAWHWDNLLSLYEGIPIAAVFFNGKCMMPGNLSNEHIAELEASWRL